MSQRIKSPRKEWFIVGMLVVAAVSATLTVVQSYSASIAPDAHAYLMFAEAFSMFSYPRNPVLDIAHADAPAGRYLVAHYSSYLWKDGVIVSKTPLGYPLLISQALGLFGLKAVYFLNGVIIAAIIAFTYLAGKEFFGNDVGCYAGASAALLLLHVNYGIVDYGLSLTRDVPSLAFVTAAFYYTLKGSPFSGFLAGVSLFFRETNLPAVALFTVYFALRGDWRKTTCYTLFLIAGASPLIVQDALTEHSILRQQLNIVGEITGTVQQSDVGDVLPMRKINGFEVIRDVYGLPLVALAVIGLAYCFRKKEVWIITLPIVIAYTIMFSQTRVPEVYRYLLVTQPFVCIMAGYGLVKALSAAPSDEKLRRLIPVAGISLVAFSLMLNLPTQSRFGRLDVITLLSGLSLTLYGKLPDDRKLSQLIVLLAVPVLLLPAHYQALTSQPFQTEEARRLSEAINGNTRENSVVITCKYLGPIVDYYSKRYSIQPYTLNSMIDQFSAVSSEDFQVNMSRQVDKIRELMDAGYSVYVIDNKRYNRFFGDLEDCEVMKDEYGKYFNVTPVITLDMEEYNLVGECGKRFCTLYELS